MTPYIKNMTLRKPVVDEQWLSLNRTIHQVAPLCRNPEHLENAARVLQAEGGLEALAPDHHRTDGVPRSGHAGEVWSLSAYGRH